MCPERLSVRNKRIRRPVGIALAIITVGTLLLPSAVLADAYGDWRDTAFIVGMIIAPGAALLAAALAQSFAAPPPPPDLLAARTSPVPNIPPIPGGDIPPPPTNPPPPSKGTA
jgi:hypothetical protein